MKEEIKVPSMGESISEATIGALLKADGARVNSDDELLELETDKVNQVLYAQQTGTVTWNVSQGDAVKIGQVIGLIEVDKEGQNKPPPQKAMPEQTQKPTAKTGSAFTGVKERATAVKTEETGGARSTKEQFIAELKIGPKPSEVKLTEAKSLQVPYENRSQENSLTERHETRKKMSKVRKVIASRLVNVLQETAMLTTFNEVDMTKVMALRDSYKDAFTKQYTVRLGFMPFFVKAVVSALQVFPDMNAYIEGDEIISRHYFDIGIAIGADKGLFVPVVRNCDTLSFADIERSIESYAKKAREGGLIPGDLQGGGFTITNGGTYGSLLSTPILNPPQSAILGMHKIMKRAVVVDDQIVIRQMMYLALSYDHRVVDGKEAVSFLVHIKNALEDPSRMLIGI